MAKSYAEQRKYRRGDSFDQLATALGLSVPGLRKWARKGVVQGAALHRGKWVLHGPLTDKRIERVRSYLRLKPAISRAWKDRRLGERRTSHAPLQKRKARAAFTRYVTALDVVESTIHNASSDACDKLRRGAVSAFRELCDASYALGCMVAQREHKPRDWARFDSCIPIVRHVIDLQGGSWRDHWLPSWKMLRDDNSLIRRLGDAFIPMGLGLIDVPLSKDPKFNQMFMDCVSLPSVSKELRHVFDLVGANLSEWHACVIKYTERRRLLESVDFTDPTGYEQCTRSFDGLIEMASSYTPKIADNVDEHTATLIEKKGWSVPKVLKLARAALTVIEHIKEPSQDQISRQVQKFILLSETIPFGLFADRANERLLANGHPGPNREEVIRMTPGEICFFIVEHDRKHFPEIHE